MRTEVAGAGLAPREPLRAASPGARPSRLGISTFRARLPARRSLPVAPRPQPPPPRGISAPPVRAVSGDLQQRSPGGRWRGERVRRSREARGRRDPQPPPALPCPSPLPFPSDSAILSLIPPPFFSATPNPRPTSLFSPAPPMPPPGRRSPPRSLPGARGKRAGLSAKFPAPPDAAPDSAQQPVTSLRIAHAIGSLWALGGRP